MVCQHCGQKEATVHVKHMINGEIHEIYACKECASEQGVGVLSAPPFTMNNIFEELFSNTFLKEAQRVERCRICGKSFRDIVQSGHVGCAECYTTFYEQLQPTIRRIHGSAVHTGKIIAVDEENSTNYEDIVQKLKEEMQEAVKRQDFERCAQIRDQLKEMEEDHYEG